MIVQLTNAFVTELVHAVPVTAKLNGNNPWQNDYMPLRQNDNTFDMPQIIIMKVLARIL